MGVALPRQASIHSGLCPRTRGSRSGRSAASGNSPVGNTWQIELCELVCTAPLLPANVSAAKMDLSQPPTPALPSSPAPGSGAIHIKTEVTVDRPRAVFHLPALTLLPGLGTFGEEKSQAVLPGVEYLENEPSSIEADTPLPFSATLIGGRGETINAAVEQYVALSGGLPPVPEYEGDFEGAVRLLAAGWLDSALHEDGTWRHAVWGDRFPARPAADAPGYMLWLAEHTADAELAGRLRAGVERGLQRLGPGGNWEARCSHAARPFAPLLFGQIEPYWLRLVRVPAGPARVELEGGKVLEREYHQERNTLNLLVEGQGVLRLTTAGSEDEQVKE